VPAAVLGRLSGTKNLPTAGQDAANLPCILSSRGCQRRTIARSSSAVDRRRQLLLRSESLVEVSGRARDGSEEERRVDGTGPPPPPRGRQCCAGKPDPRRAARSYPRSVLVVGPQPGGGQIVRRAAGHRQVADEMRQRVDASDEAAERTAFA
jgi:hypothetical protein